jgi:hypothetical protein
MKKTWIKVKRGILEAKHRRKLGITVFLYLYILDNVNWDTGIIYEWTDEAAAEELEIPLSTLRDHRRKLEDELYIQTTQKSRCLEISVRNWTNPREYSGQIYNEGDEITEPSEVEGDTVGYTVGSETSSPVHKVSHNHIDTLNKDIYYEPCDEEGNPIKEKKKKEPKQPTHPAIVAFRRTTGRYPPKTNYDWIISILGEEPDELKLHKCKEAWDRRGYNGNSLNWVEWYRDGIPNVPFKKPIKSDENYWQTPEGMAEAAKNNEIADEKLKSWNT